MGVVRGGGVVVAYGPFNYQGAFTSASNAQFDAILRARGVHFIGPDEGMLACGYEGAGRLWPVEKIADEACALLAAR